MPIPRDEGRRRMRNGQHLYRIPVVRFISPCFKAVAVGHFEIDNPLGNLWNGFFGRSQ